MTKRLVALAGAIAMVVISLVVRNQFIDDDGDNDSGGQTADEGDVAIACVRELEEVCAQLDADVTVEPAGTTAARLADDDVPYDAWLTFAPFAEGGDVLARTGLAVALRPDRAEVLTAHCGEITWTCVGDVAGEPWSSIGGDEAWGTIRPAHPEPVGSGLGRLVLGQAVTSFLGRDDYSRIDWEANDDFPGWFQRLERAVPSDAFDPNADPFERWLQRGRIGSDVVATTAAQAAGRDDITVIYPAPVATAEVVLAPVAGGRDLGSLAEDVRDALSAEGYDVNGDAPDGDGLPAPGVLEALTQYWEGVVQ